MRGLYGIEYWTLKNSLFSVFYTVRIVSVSYYPNGYYKPFMEMLASIDTLLTNTVYTECMHCMYYTAYTVLLTNVIKYTIIRIK